MLPQSAELPDEALLPRVPILYLAPPPDPSRSSSCNELQKNDCAITSIICARSSSA
jgi:hypothetical protein